MMLVTAGVYTVCTACFKQACANKNVLWAFEKVVLTTEMCRKNFILSEENKSPAASFYHS
jgi:hypothetical protein